MLDNLEIGQSEAFSAAVIYVNTPRDQMQTTMTAAISELMATVNKQGIGPAGPLFAHHKRQSDGFEFEVGVPVSGSVNTIGRVKAGQLPAATVARVVYSGAYEGLHSAWAEFYNRLNTELGAQMTERGLKPGPTFWESYVQGPESNPNPETFRTELVVPLIDV